MSNNVWFVSNHYKKCSLCGQIKKILYFFLLADKPRTAARPEALFWPHDVLSLSTLLDLRKKIWVGRELVTLTWIHRLLRHQSISLSASHIGQSAKIWAGVSSTPIQFLRWGEFAKPVQCVCFLSVPSQYACKHPWSGPAHRDSYEVCPGTDEYRVYYVVYANKFL